MKYKGIELKEVTEPQLFDPPKDMFVWDDNDDDDESWSPSQASVCAIVRHREYPVITVGAYYRHCAYYPEPKPVTYRELARWLAEGNGEVNDDLNDEGAIHTSQYYWKGQENDAVGDSIRVRKWDDTEWHKPTREYLGLEDCPMCGRKLVETK